MLYTNDFDPPGEGGLDLHVNDVPTGDPVPPYPGADGGCKCQDRTTRPVLR